VGGHCFRSLIVKFLRINVVAGIIINQNMILIGKRKDKDIGGGKWEFPGGKIEVGETNSEALERELYEELGISVKIGKELMNYEHVFKTTIYNITFMEIIDYEGEICNNAHSEIKWVKFPNLPEYDFISGDDRFIQSLIKSKPE
jgi:ADP-ribose pyrophosphatase